MRKRNWSCGDRTRLVANRWRRRISRLRLLPAKHVSAGAFHIGRHSIEHNTRPHAENCGLSRGREPNGAIAATAAPQVAAESVGPGSHNESGRAKLIFETPNLRLFDIGVDHASGTVNFGWAETSEGCWGAVGDVEGHLHGGQSLWLTLWGNESVSCSTKHGWLIVAIDGRETSICLAHRIDYLHIHGAGGNLVDLSRIKANSFPPEIIIEVQRVASVSKLFGTAYGDRVIGADEDLNQGETNDTLFLASDSQIELGDDSTITDSTEPSGNEAIVVALPKSLFCDVVIMDSANLGLPGGCQQLPPADVSLDHFLSSVQDDTELDEDGRLEGWNRATLRKRSTSRQRVR